MKRLLFLIALIFTLTRLSFAQIRATTEQGHQVLLYGDGTWQYENKSSATADESSLEAGLTSATAISLDSSKDAKTEYEELFHLPSASLT
jgi:hypothetical protein